MDRSYIAFISYKHAPLDAAIAKRVHTLIENYVVPKALRKGSKKLGIVFRDEEELPISSDLTESIRMALDASRYLIVICTPESKASPWVAREIDYFLQHHDAKNAFVILAKGEPDEVFPYKLTHILNEATGECEEVEPLALDVRADSVGESLKKVKGIIKKLYAAMLGCSYDSLVQREKTRRMKRIAALAMICVLVAGCFVGMLFSKNRELSRKNDQLTEAIGLALQRESELLAEDADAALQNGDVVEAMRNASAALLSEEIERPYYAPAERVLLSALDVMGTRKDKALLSKTELSHRSPVEMMACSEDGKLAYTIDFYGTVRCFETAEGDTVWETKIPENSISFSRVEVPLLWYDSASNSLTCHYGGTIAKLDASTGRFAWLHECNSKMESGLYFNAERNEIGYFVLSYDNDSANILKETCCYVGISSLTGEVLRIVPILSTGDREFINLPVSANYHDVGVFANGDRFIGTFFLSKMEDHSSGQVLYTIDLSENSVHFIEKDAKVDADGAYSFKRLVYLGDDKVLCVNASGELIMKCYDIKEGRLLWKSSVDVPRYIEQDEECHVIVGSEVIFVGVGNFMAVVGKDDGEIQSSVSLFDTIIDLYKLTDRFFSFTLANGYCAVGWLTNYGLMDSNSYNAIVDLPDTDMVYSCKGGLVHPVYDGDTPTGFEIMPVQKGGGSILYLSEDKCSVYVATVLPKPELPPTIQLEPQDSVSTRFGDYIDTNRQGTVLMGPVLLNEGDGLTVVDTANHSYHTILLDDSFPAYSANYYLTDDGRHVIACTDYGSMYKLGIDGALETLSEYEYVVLTVVGDMEYVDYLHDSDAARQTADGTIISAKCDGKQISYWTDGGDETVVSVPEDVCWAVYGNLAIYSLFRTGENGILLLSDFVSDTAEEIDSFAIYNLSTQKWTRVSDVARGSKNRPLVFGQKTPVFAVYDEDMNIRVYDCDQEKLVYCINTGLPIVSVEKMGMLIEDQYMYLITKDGQLIIYCLATGEIAFSTFVSGDFSLDAFTTWLDQGNYRLYTGVNGEALCIDVRTWEQLIDYSDNDDFEFYNASQNEIYVSSYDADASAYILRAIPIPSTADLVDIARNILG